MDQTITTKIKETLDTIFEECKIEADFEFVTEEIKNDTKVATDDDNTDEPKTMITVEISSVDSSILIGYHGETLASIEHIVNLILFKETGNWQGVRIDISNYKKERKSKLLDIADSAVNKAHFLNKSIALMPMNNFERKIIHEYIAENYPDMVSYSDGEGYNRRIIIAINQMETNSESE